MAKYTKLTRVRKFVRFCHAHNHYHSEYEYGVHHSETPKIIHLWRVQPISVSVIPDCWLLHAQNECHFIAEFDGPDARTNYCVSESIGWANDLSQTSLKCGPIIGQPPQPIRRRWRTRANNLHYKQRQWPSVQWGGKIKVCPSGLHSRNWWETSTERIRQLWPQILQTVHLS